MAFITIGKIVKPQGIKGELKVLPMLDSAETFCSLKRIFVDGEELKILSARVADGVYLALKGIADRNAAETYRNKFVSAMREDIDLPEGRWFVSDVLGCGVFLDDGSSLGIVTDITTRGGTDVYTVSSPNGKTVAFPLLKTLIVSVDIAARKMILKADKLAEVALYED